LARNGKTDIKSSGATTRVMANSNIIETTDALGVKQGVQEAQRRLPLGEANII
jgi:hypothetical protein